MCVRFEGFFSTFQIILGEILPVTQDDIKLNGWSFEARIYAEDPDNDFMPGEYHIREKNIY